MPPRAPVVWTTTAVRSERFRQRLDERHRELTIYAKARGRTYRRLGADVAIDEVRRVRADFIAALGRLASFEIAMSGLASCKYELQLNERADDLSRDYFQLWHLIARRSGAAWPEEERESERLDYFAMQVGRLEGIADALVVAGRNVRLYPLPEAPWLNAS
jgi:hypothetical protein